MRQSQGSRSARSRPLRERGPRRDGEAVAQVALALAQHLVVGGQHEAVVARGLRPLGEEPGEAAVAVHEDLHPFRARTRPRPRASIGTVEPWLRT